MIGGAEEDRNRWRKRGDGTMGLSMFFAGCEHRVTVAILDPTDAAYPVTNISEACAQSPEVIVVSTPVTAEADILEEIFAIGIDALVFDVLSVKTPVSGIFK